MINSILLKEWLKLKGFIALSAIIFVGIFLYFWQGLNFEFATIEPETMMWYRFNFLDYKPYDFFKWLFLAFALFLALSQFLPEAMRNRLRIVAHLPLNLWTSLSLHLGLGLFIILAFFIVTSFSLYFLLGVYYPAPILKIFWQDSFANLLSAIIMFLGISAAILEKNLVKAGLKLLLTLLALAIFLELAVNAKLFFWLMLPVILFILNYDSFLSAKQQNLQLVVSLPVLGLALVLLVGTGYKVVQEKLYTHIHGFYLFYSPIEQKVVYQKNFGEHQFEYGFADGQSFDRKTYEAKLPFVYWADLDIQGKLPIAVQNATYTKKQIKDARLSLAYRPEYLEAKMDYLYPLLNSIKTQGVIVFPENMLYAHKNSFVVYHADTSVEQDLTADINAKTNLAGLEFPVQNIWGRATNMKVYDLGYFVKDAKGEIYNLRRGDNANTIEKIAAPKNLVYISINENKQKKIAGFAIDAQGKVYAIKWDNLEFVGVDLKGFDYRNMELQILSNPKYYQFRYDDESSYFISVFDKEFNFIDRAKLDY